MTDSDSRAVIAAGAKSLAVDNAERSVIIVGDGNTVHYHGAGAEGGDLVDVKRAQEPPLRAREAPPLPPAPLGDHLDRDGEASAILASVSPVNVHGARGVGKSYLLRYAANRPGAHGRDGIIHVDAGGKGRADLLVDIFEQLYEMAPHHTVRDGEIERRLRDTQAVVFIDHFGLDRHEAEALFATLSRCRVIVASEEQRTWQGTPIELQGLDLDHAMIIMERQLRRTLTEAERHAAEAIHRSLGGNTARIGPVASVSARRGGPSLEEMAQRLTAADGIAAAVDLVLESSTADERRVVATLAVFGSSPIDAQVVGAISGVDGAEAVLTSLELRGVVASTATGHGLSGVTAEEIGRRIDLEEATDAAVGYLARWAEEHQHDIESQREKRSALLAILGVARRRHRHAEAIRIGMVISAATALSRRWGAWDGVLDTVLISAQESGDRLAEGWALHQIGTRHLCLGNRRAGVTALRRALAIRERLGDMVGVEATRHNLGQARRLRVFAALPFRLQMPLLGLAIMLGIGGGAALWAESSTDTRALSLSMIGAGTGMVVSSPPGVECGSKCTTRFDSGTDVALTAAAVPGSVFVGWRGGGCSGDRTCTLDLVSSVTVHAEFQPIGRTASLTISTKGDGRGTVTSSPSGIDCGGLCSANFEAGKRVTLTATALERAIFVRWEGGSCSGSGQCEMTLDNDASVVAVFQPAAGTHTVRVTRDGQGRGAVTSFPAAIDCGASCSASFRDGAAVTLTATAQRGSVFRGWDGGGCSGTDRCTITARSNTSVRATFDVSPQARELTVVKRGSGAGRVTSSPAGLDCAPSCVASFLTGERVTLTAAATPGSLFSGWSGGGCSGAAPCTVLIGPDTRDVSAVFERAAVTRTLRVSTDGTGEGRVVSSSGGIDCGAACTASLADGAVVELSASAAKGSVFAKWDYPGCAVGASRCTVTLRADTTVAATFNEEPSQLLNMKAKGDGAGIITTSVSGVQCPWACSTSLPKDTRLTLTAVADKGSIFTGWSGRCTGTGPCTFTLSQDSSVTANFQTGWVVTVTVTGAGGGTVTSSPPGSPPIDCRTSCSATFPKGTTVTLTGKPAQANTSFGWSKGCTGTNSVCSITLQSDIEVSIDFPGLF